MTRSTRREYLKSMAVGGVALGAGGLIAACGGSSSATSTGGSSGATGGSPKRGGTLRVGFNGGGSGDTLNPLAPVANVDYARVNNLFDPLALIDGTGKPELYLAQEVIPNRDATVWDIRLRSGVTFHNGKPLTAEDLMFTLALTLNPKAPGEGASALGALDVKGMKKLDRHTVRVPFTRPMATLVEVLATSIAPYVVPVGFNAKQPVGTGPFKYESFTAGQQSTFLRNPDYWKTGMPYVDRIVMTDYSDETAQTNALVSNQADVIASLSTDVKAQIQSAGQKLLISEGAGFNPFTMRTDQAPFNDVRVRQAMRLLVDREQMRNIVFGGQGLLGNDVFGIYASEYDHGIAQRQRDVAQAKSLLKAAGREGLTVELVTADLAQGVVKCAQALAQQALDAGVKIKLRQVTSAEFFGPNYLKWVFSQDYWDYNFYFPQVADSTIPGAPFSETHFDNPRYTQLYRQATATLDQAKRTEIAHEMQMIDYNEGGYIIPFFIPVIDGYRSNVGGVKGGKSGQSFNDWDFKSMWLQ